MVRMRHDGIEQVIEVAEISVTTYERSGWQVVSEDGQPIEKNTITTAAKRRRAETEGEN